jgi:drug/metabolite transporter (DMT)-like permease
MIPAFLAATFFAASATTGRVLAGIFSNGAQVNLYRLIISSVVLGCWALTTGNGLFGPGWLTLWVSGFIGFGLGDVALFHSLRSLGARLTVMLIHCLATPMAGLMEWVFIGTRIRPVEGFVTFFILAGVLVALLGQNPLSRKGVTGRELPWKGWIWGIIASLGQAGGAVLSRSAYGSMQAAGVESDALSIAWIRILGGVVFSFLYLVASSSSGPVGRWPVTHRGRRFRVLFGLLILNGLLGPAIGVSCFQWALRTTPTALVLPVVALAPVLLIPVSEKIDGTRPTLLSIAGGLIAIISVVILGIFRES